MPNVICLNEPSHSDRSFEYPQHMFGLSEEEMIIVNYAFLSGGLFILADYSENIQLG